MVMEAPPSPQSVGREFVRQYYTLLNKAPTHLHRFYNQQSSFVHGGLDLPNRETSPVIGQKQIHQKIQHLNFRDCHAKITQVDSQATLGKGVVVQVTGELSNAGQPMRRFTQTFVLAAQSPKKYYVHNDIFRYQDEIISDEECETENRSEPEEDVSQECQVMGDVQPLSQPPMQYYNPNTTAMQPNIPQPSVVHHHPPQSHVLAPQVVPTVTNGAVHPEDINVLAGGAVPPHVGQGQVLGNLQPQSGGMVQPPMNPPAVIEEAPQVFEPEIEEDIDINCDDGSEQEIDSQDLNPEPAMTSNEPKTYANLLKSGNNIPYNAAPPMVSVVQSPPQQRSITPPPMGPKDQSGINNRNNLNRGPRVNNQQQQPRIPRQDSFRGAPARNSYNEDGNEERKRPQSNFGDMNQLFLGNLPHTATEDELREIFIEFGNILDLRVHSKTLNKAGPPGVRATPNYGFITYDSHQAVQNCLDAKPIYYPKGDKNGVPLNVEEKKTKDRQMYGGNRPNNNENRIRDNNGPRRGGPGGSGGLGQNRNNAAGGNSGGSAGITPNRTNSYNKFGGGGGGAGGGNGGGPQNRGPNTYNNRR